MQLSRSNACVNCITTILQLQQKLTKINITVLSYKGPECCLPMVLELLSQVSVIIVIISLCMAWL